MEYLYGRRPVNEVLMAGKRRIKKAYIDQKPGKTSGILREILYSIDDLEIPVEVLQKNQMSDKVRGANHQGIILEASPYEYSYVDEILDYAGEKEEKPLILILDLLQDVQNVGTLIRSAEAVGAHGIILQERRAASITPAVVSASSGAAEHMHVAQVTNLVSVMIDLKENDVWFAGLDTGPDSVPYTEANLSGALGLVVGSEGKGIRRLVRETCDFIINMPMRGQIESLNAAVAGSIALYAALSARS